MFLTTKDLHPQNVGPVSGIKPVSTINFQKKKRTKIEKQINSEKRVRVVFGILWAKLIRKTGLMTDAGPRKQQHKHKNLRQAPAKPQNSNPQDPYLELNPYLTLIFLEKAPCDPYLTLNLKKEIWN